MNSNGPEAERDALLLNDPPDEAPSIQEDCRIIGEFITDELEVRRRSAEPVPDEDEAAGIADADNARLALIRIRQITFDYDRFRRGLMCLRDCKLEGVDFGDYVQSVVEDLLMGAEVECSECGTTAHDGECVDPALDGDDPRSFV
jgi:hypothetical protein